MREHCHRHRLLIHRGSNTQSLGFRLKVIGTNVVVSDLTEHGVFAKAGAEVGDILAAINGVPLPYPLNKRVPPEVGRLINSPRLVLEFTVIRGDVVNMDSSTPLWETRSNTTSPTKETPNPKWNSPRAFATPSPLREKTPKSSSSSPEKRRENEPNFPPPNLHLDTPRATTPHKSPTPSIVISTAIETPSPKKSSRASQSSNNSNTNTSPRTSITKPRSPTSTSSSQRSSPTTKVVNNNGELRALLLKIFQCANTNEQPSISKEELNRIVHGDEIHSILTEHPILFVTDDDGDIDVTKMFARLDKDHNGFIGLMEFLRVAKLIKADANTTNNNNNNNNNNNPITTTTNADGHVTTVSSRNSMHTAFPPSPSPSHSRSPIHARSPVATEVMTDGSSPSPSKRIELSPSRPTQKFATAV